VVQTVLSALGRGGLKVPAGRSVAVNIAGQTLGDSDSWNSWSKCFDHTGASPVDICFEVTESSVVANLDMRAASSRCCTAWAANSRWMISAAV